MTFHLEGTHTICTGCGARIGPTIADRIEHLTTPSRARADHKRRTNPPTTEKEAS